jgi:pyruvate/2-oxoacid:ferredoxin oxidoreductase alpha subunit
MNFSEFIERAFCLIVLGLTIAYTKLEARKVNESKENAMMALEDYRIPLFVGEDGVILALSQKPILVIAEEYIDEERCKIQDEPTHQHWVWNWLQFIEYVE